MFKNLDIPLFLLIIAIGAISLLVIFSINKNLAQNQFVFWLIGLAILLLFSFFGPETWQKFAPGLYIGSIILLVLLPFIGESVRGSVRWIDLGAFRFQPSEIAKVGSILLLAEFFSKRSAGNLKNLFVSFLILFVPTALVFAQPDIGNALSFGAIWFGIAILAGFRLKHILMTLFLALIVVVFTYEILAPYQKERIASFLHPEADPLDTGYNLIQSKIAVGSGQLFGRGLGSGSQSQLKFLPEAESDFIFASTSEQLGFFGASVLIILYSALILRITKIAYRVEKFSQLVIVGCVVFLLFQFFVNVGMNMGIVPVTGITLPLVSYGGSSLVSTLVLLGIIFSIGRSRVVY